MAQSELYLFRDPASDSVPFLEWLHELPPKVRAKCALRVNRLAELGHELRRPEADFLRNGIYELRANYQGVNYRILYFFAGHAIVVVSHGLIKEGSVPPSDIDLAIDRKKEVEIDFKRFTFRPE